MKRSFPLLACTMLMSCGIILNGCSLDHRTGARTEPAMQVSDAATPAGTSAATSPALATVPVSARATTPSPIPIDTVVPPAMSIPGRLRAAAPFRWQVKPATRRGLGASWHPGCPAGIASLSAVSMTYWGFDGRVHGGVIVLNQAVVTRARAVFATMYKRKFPLRSVIPTGKFAEASDDASMAADNTSAFNCRIAVATGAPSWSRHAYGMAIDVNPVENPYIFGKKILPPSGAKYRNRSKVHPGVIRKGDAIYTKFLKVGFRWGGSFKNPDYQHFDR